MEKETIKEKNLWEKIQESYGRIFTFAGMIFIALIFIWISSKLIPILASGSANIATTLSSFLLEDEAEKISQTDESSSTSTTKNPSQTSEVKKQKVYYGKPDLQTTLISTGIIDPVSKKYMETNYAGYNDEIAIRFEVKNVGTNISGAWRLRINTPSRTTPYYDSVDQVSIKPGDKIIFTTSFDSPVNMGINTAYITADPLNIVDEVSENNNQIIVPLKIEGTSYSYNNNYNYGASSPVINLPYGTLYTWSNINVNCYANPQTSYIGLPTTWIANVSGGNGYYEYRWAGSDELYGSQNNVVKTYYSSGTKTASVTVTSNGVSVTKQCNAYIY